MTKREIKCPHKIPISTCPEHWAIFNEVAAPELTLDDELDEIFNEFATDTESDQDSKIASSKIEIHVLIALHDAQKKAALLAGLPKPQSGDMHSYNEGYSYAGAVSSNEVLTEVRAAIEAVYRS